MMDTLARVATEMTEASRSSVIEVMFSKVEEQKKKLQFCFGCKLYPDAVRMSLMVPAIKCGGGVSHRVAIEDAVVALRVVCLELMVHSTSLVITTLMQAELMEAERASDLDFDYIATMVTEEHTGVRIEAAKKIKLLLKHMDSWAVYAVDMEKKICMVLEPVQTDEPQHEVEAKHKRNATRVLSNLRRCIHECI